MLKPPQPVLIALNMLESAGHEAYIIGGCVRDSLLGINPEDYDITTSALPDETAQIFADHRIIATGLKHGTLTVLIEGMALEITTFRTEGTYSDSRHPDSVNFTRSLHEDVFRRDFTMNAIAATADGKLIDLCGGRQDMEKGVIRCVGDAHARFGEDALRIMRAIRFASVLGFELDTDTRQAVFDSREQLRLVSAERIYSELCKLLCGKTADRIIMEYTSVLEVVLPELAALSCDELCIAAAAVCSAPQDISIRLAALLHSCTESLEVSAELADRVMLRLKTDTAARKRVTELVRWYDLPLSSDPQCIKRLLGRLSPELFFALLTLKRSICLAHKSAASDQLSKFDDIETAANDILHRGECYSISQLAVNGNDLIGACHKKGKAIGLLLDRLLDAVISGEADNTLESLLAYVQELDGC